MRRIEGMTKSQKLTAEAVLSAPRRGTCTPNHDGRLGLYTVSRHIFGDKTVTETRLLDFEAQTSTTIIDDDQAYGARWMPGTNDVAYLKSSSNGKTELFVSQQEDTARSEQLVASFGAPINAWKLRLLLDGGIVIVVAGSVGPDGSRFNDQIAEPKSTGRIFDDARVRNWNNLYKPKRYTLWYNMLEKQGGKWTLAGELLNLILDESLEPAYLHGPGNAEDCLDISDNGIVFGAVDLTTRQPEELGFPKAYYVAMENYSTAPIGKPQVISLPPNIGIGNLGNVRFSPDKSSIAFLHGAADETCAFRLYLTRLSSLVAHDVIQAIGETFDNDSFDPIAAFEFSIDDSSIVFLSEKRGRKVLSSLKLQKGEEPQWLHSHGSISTFAPMRDGNWENIIICGSSFVENSIWQIVSAQDATVLRTISPTADESSDFGLSPGMVTEMDIPGADDHPIHCFAVRPSDFDEEKVYPWVLLIHGGPVAAWSDAWLSTWNAAVLAEQGFVVVCPNITGSSGYGLEHARRIRGDWLGRPHTDVVNITDRLGQVPYLDPSKAIVAGASYGGLMISWMMGHDIIKKFCGAIWQSGIVNMATFPLYMDGYWYDSPFGGAIYPWQDPVAFQKFNPASPVLLRNWKNAPPTLVVHSEKDYRCPITEGLAAFKTLQAHGVPSRFLTFPDECHQIENPENLKVYLETVWDWMECCVSGEIKRNPLNRDDEDPEPTSERKRRGPYGLKRLIKSNAIC